MGVLYNKKNRFVYIAKKVLFPLFIGFGLLWYLYKDVNFYDIFEVLRKDVDIPIFLFGLLFGFMAHVTRGLRWYLLVKPISTHKVDIRNSILSVLGSYAVNMVIPRSGELWRCWSMSKRENLGFDKLFGTLIVDRLVDVFMLIFIMIAAAVLFSSDFYNLFSGLNNRVKLANTVTFVIDNWFFILIVVLVLLISFYYIYRHLKGNSKIRNIINGVMTGIKTVFSMQYKLLFIIESLFIWLCYYLFFYINFYAFPFTVGLGWKIGLIVFAINSMASIVPVQGGIGAWHLLVISSLTILGISDSQAHSFAFIVHTSQTIVISLVGMISIFLLPLINKNKNYEPNSK